MPCLNISGVFKKMNRKKTLEDDVMKTPLSRCLSTFDLILFGIGQMGGPGIFVISGTVIHSMAGPGAILSYLLAGIAAMLASLCYAEFGSKIPKAGSAYSYTYIIIGEFWAFIVGWNIILEYLISTSAAGRGFSGALSAVLLNKVNGTLENFGSVDSGLFFTPYLDFVAFGSILATSVVLSFGARTSANINNLFTLVNIVVIVLVTCIAFAFAKSESWTDGFLPFGVNGIFGGAAASFYTYIGFDAITIAGEEAKEPGKSVPIASVSSVLMCSVLYVISITSLTLLVPYTDISTRAPFPDAFADRGYYWVKVFVGLGTLVAMATSLLVTLYALPRAIYAMSSDGLFFSVFSRIYERTQTPVVTIMTFGTISALLALLLDIETLVEFLSIGTLLAYTIVAGAVIVLRYQPLEDCQFELHDFTKADEHKSETNVENEVDSSSSDIEESKVKSKVKNYRTLYNGNEVSGNGKKDQGDKRGHGRYGSLKGKLKDIPFLKGCEPGNAAAVATIFLAMFMAGFLALVLYALAQIQHKLWWSILIMILLIMGIVVCFLVILAHVQNEAFKSFQVT